MGEGVGGNPRFLVLPLLFCFPYFPISGGSLTTFQGCFLKMQLN